MTEGMPDRRTECPRMSCSSLSAWTDGRWMTTAEGGQCRAYDYQCDRVADHNGIVLIADSGSLTLR